MQKLSYSVIGLMSGTSLDGLDLAWVNFERENEGWTFKLNYCQTIKFPEVIIERIIELQGCSDRNKLMELDFRLAEYFSKCVNDFISNNAAKIDFVSSHGQTIYHSPKEKLSIQLGNGKIMSELTGIPIICDFRIQDVELGGQGAPLVPIGDLLLFPDFKYCLNLGGISNISRKLNGNISASDLSICNTALNHFAKMEGLEYDNEGKLASEGMLNEQLYEKLCALEYHSQAWPKSLDSSYFYKVMLPLIETEKNIQAKDILCTMTHYIARQVKDALHDNSTVLVTGGGSHNNFLIETMKQNFSIDIHRPDDVLIDFKEALIFAFLGLLRYRGETNVLSSVTGACKDHCSGRIYVRGQDYDFVN